MPIRKLVAVDDLQLATAMLFRQVQYLSRYKRHAVNGMAAMPTFHYFDLLYSLLYTKSATHPTRWSSRLKRKKRFSCSDVKTLLNMSRTDPSDAPLINP